jgi:hypothetical protein
MPLRAVLGMTVMIAMTEASETKEGTGREEVTEGQ